MRKYKGEGTIQFICYEPYAHSIHKFLDQYTTEYSYYNPVTSAPSITGMSVPSIYLPGANQYTYTMDEWLEQWKAGSGMATHSTTYNFGDAGSNINLYNPGDVEADFLAFFPASVVTNSGLRIRIEKDVNEVHGQLYLKPFTVATGDSYICINSKTNLIEGIKGDISLDNRSGNLYNQYILAGDFFKIPMATDTSHLYKFKSHSCTGTAVNNAVNCSKLIYDYLYY